MKESVMTRRTKIVLACAMCIIYGWSIARHVAPFSGQVASASLAVPSFSHEPGKLKELRESRRPFFTSEFVSVEPTPGNDMAHAASVCQLRDGRLAAVWYAGSAEGAPDVAVLFSMRGAEAGAGADANARTRAGSSWSKPRPIADAESATKELSRYVRKVGNPVIYADSEDNLWLLYVSISFGGWSCSSLNVKISKDAGATWTPSKRLVLSPFLNISQLVRGRPLPLTDGGLAAPIYHECFGKFAEILWIRPGANGDRNAVVCWKTRITAGRSYIQPSIVVSESGPARSFFRSTSDDRAVAAADSIDGGRTWSQPAPCELPNPDSSVSAVLMPGDRILLAFNDSEKNRNNLRLALSASGSFTGRGPDDNTDWQRIATIENEDNSEFSYPFLFRDRDGDTHLVYTWRKERIKHVTFNDAWIEEQAAKQAASAAQASN